MIMIIIYISTTCVEAIKPRQIINYDTGIVLIDLHQQRKNNFEQYKSTTLNTGQPHVNEEPEPAEQQPATSFPNQMIEQINIALEQKGSGNFFFFTQQEQWKPAVGGQRQKGIYIN